MVTMRTPGCGLLVAAAILIGGAAYGAAQQPSDPSRWVTAWATSQQSLGMTSVSNATVRMIARVTVPGGAIRLRLDNAFGTTPLTIGTVRVGLRIQGAAVASGSTRQASFGGRPSVTIPPGGTVLSDPVPIAVHAWQDLAISLYIPSADVRPSQHNGAVVTSYLSANGSGDVGADESRAPFTATTTSMFWLKAVDVLPPSPASTIVAFGDSITDGTCSTLDAHDRWEDWLAVRLQTDDRARGLGAPLKAVINEGIGGNTVTGEGLQPPANSPPATERLDRDVLSHAGVSDVIVFVGTNDIRRDAPAAQVIAGLEDIARRVKARGLRVTGVTIIPRHNVAPSGDNRGWDDGKTAIRHEVNRWIRTSAPFDAVIDFDEVVRDPAHPDLIAPAFNCGDGIHPSPFGYYTMGGSISLDLFTLHR